jgi:hypothetical protein
LNLVRTDLAEAGGTGATAVNIIGSAGFYGVTAGGLRAATGGTKNIPFGNGLPTAKERFLPEWMSPTDEQTDGVSL